MMADPSVVSLDTLALRVLPLLALRECLKTLGNL